jgi:hypothetical protein
MSINYVFYIVDTDKNDVFFLLLRMEAMCFII